ncbi:MAG TPA: neprosin family prolyl endopeptidase, partial [Thermoanaerobaculia bacterium]
DDVPPDNVNQLVPPPPPQAPAPPPPAPAHKYAVGTQAVNNLGGSAHLSLWRPPINQPATEVFSLSQEWYVGGASANLQTVEGGWQVFPRKYRTNNPATFIYWTPDNYTTGCYNLDCVAFVQVNRFFALGAGWGNWSVRGGAQVGFRMKWQLINGNWWLSMQGAGAAQWVGYYPGRIFRGGQLTRNATRAEFGGETFGTTSWPPMGSGAFAAGGWRQAAFQRNIYYLDLTRTPIWTTLAPQQPSPACYTFAFFAPAGGGAWGAYSFFGGPGGGGC